MAVFSAPFSAIAVTAAQDVWELVTPATTKAALLEVQMGQYSDAGDAAAEILSVRFIRGFSTSGSGGSTITPVNLHNHSGALASVCTVERNNTTVAQDGTGTEFFSTAWNVQVPFVWKASIYRDEIPILAASSRLLVRITAPADEITLNGTLIFEEIGFS